MTALETLPGWSVTVADPSALVAVPPAAVTTAEPGGDGPLPGTAAGSRGGRDAELGVVVLALLTSVVTELLPVVPLALLDPPVDPPAPVLPVSEVSELGVVPAPAEEPLETVDELAEVTDVSLPPLTLPETVTVFAPEEPVVVAFDKAPVVSTDVLVTVGAGGVGLVIGDGEPPELVTSVVEPLDESASRRPVWDEAVIGFDQSVLSAVACD